VVATCGAVAVAGRDGGPPPVGRPIARTACRLVDRLLRPAALGAPGEIALCGAGLARGYLRRAAATAERFVPDPWNPAAGARLYHTGDLARLRPDGRLDFLGRADAQVKVRGFRIELGEIEAALARLPGVEQAVVVVRDDRGGERRLVAYLAVPDEPIPEAELRRGLGAELPAYMVPSAFVCLPALPLTARGKVDRRALPAPPTARPAPPGGQATTPLERRLAEIWQQVLGLPAVGLDDHFFELGGSSLLAVAVQTRIEAELSTSVSLLDLFEHPTLRALANHLGQGAAAPAVARPALEEKAARQRQAFERQREQMRAGRRSLERLAV
jgi:hypothetical protein